MSKNTNLENGEINKSIVATNFKYLMIVMCLVQILDSFCTVFPGAIPSLIAAEFLGEYDINTQNSIMAFATGLVTIGMYFLFFNQYFADKIGRKKMLAVTILGMTAAALGMSLSTNYFMYMFFVFLMNFFFSSDIWLIYINEESKPTKRALYSNIALMAGLFGPIIMVISRFIFITETEANWRGMTLFPIFFGFPLFFLVVFTIRESSRYQMIKVDRSKAIKRSFTEDLKSIFQTEQRRSYLALLLIATIRGASSIYMGLFEKYIADVGTISQSSVTLIFFMTVFTVLIAYAINGILADRVGRKPILCLWCFLAPFSVITWVFGAQNPEHAFIIVFIGYAISHITYWGSLGMIRLINIELIPTDRRGTGVGFRNLIGAIGGTVGLLLSSIVILFLGLGMTFVIFILGYFIIIPITYVYIKETKGVELATIK
ncbi:MAG: MFS transporter [Promethearchaeota archaeon]